MIFILILLLALSIILLSNKNIENLDNCNIPPIKGSTQTEMSNSHQLNKLQQQFNNLDGYLRKQVGTNTAQIDSINSNIKGVGDLNERVTELGNIINTTHLSIQNLNEQINKTIIKIENERN
tara:strand:- start:190 stop:555 length:366 start_codon:yes stop_codon:yes gene_type:complete